MNLAFPELSSFVGILVPRRALYSFETNTNNRNFIKVNLNFVEVTVFNFPRNLIYGHQIVQNQEEGFHVGNLINYYVDVF